MARFIESQSPLNNALKGLVQGVDEGLPYLMERLGQREKSKSQQSDSAILKRLGIDVEGIEDPNVRQSLIASGIKKRELKDQYDADEESFETIKDTWGEKFAKVWRASGQGERTALTQAAIDSGLRKEDLEDMFHIQSEKGKQSDPQASQELTPQKTPQINERGEIPSDFKFPDYGKRPAGYTPKEWNEEKKLWRKENSPVFEEAKTRLKNNERDALGIKKLSKTNDTRNVGEGFERLLINPNSGEFYGIAQLAQVVSPEAQEWVKEISRFGNRAKDAFGSRVTNFDLVQYMKQFPGLLNTFEGRRRILQMMDVNNKLDHLYDSALKQVYQKKGLGGIPQEEADRLAQEFIEEETERLREAYLNLDAENQSSTGQGEKPKRASLEEIFG